MTDGHRTPTPPRVLHVRLTKRAPHATACGALPSDYDADRRHLQSLRRQPLLDGRTWCAVCLAVVEKPAPLAHRFDGTCSERGACAEFAPKPAPRVCGSCDRPFTADDPIGAKRSDVPDVCTDCREGIDA